MNSREIVQERLRNQCLSGRRRERPADAVEWMCAVQGQDYRGSLWGIGLRTKHSSELDVERAIAERAIVRTWPMRGTLHLVASKDASWMLELLGPRVLARCKGRNRLLDLDDATFAKSRALFERALQGGRALARPDAYALLEHAGIATRNQRGLHILTVLALQGVLCLGVRSERQPTFVLLKDWIPKPRELEPDEALAELAHRYFASHGPATLADFSWWSGLPLGDARRALAIVGPTLVKRVSAAKEYWSAPPLSTSARSTTAYLLPAWDEFTVAYRDRGAFLDPADSKRAGNGIFSAVIVVDGRVAGLWRNKQSRGTTTIETELFGRHNAAVHEAVEHAVARYRRFVDSDR